MDACQCSTPAYPDPRITRKLVFILDCRIEDFVIIGYDPHPQFAAQSSRLQMVKIGCPCFVAVDEYEHARATGQVDFSSP